MTDLQIMKKPATATAHQSILSPAVKTPTHSGDPTVQNHPETLEHLNAGQQFSSHPSSSGPAPFGHSMQYTQPFPRQETTHASARRLQEMKWSASTPAPQRS